MAILILFSCQFHDFVTDTCRLMCTDKIEKELEGFHHSLAYILVTSLIVRKLESNLLVLVSAGYPYRADRDIALTARGTSIRQLSGSTAASRLPVLAPPS